LFEEYVLPIWDYGKNDRLVQRRCGISLTLLRKHTEQPAINKLLQKVHAAIDET
jgi:hypothetical protein